MEQPCRKIKDREELWEKMRQWEEINGPVVCERLKTSVAELEPAEKRRAKDRALLSKVRRQLHMRKK